MPVYRLIDAIVFPPPHGAEQGLVAVGGDLRPERLIAAYQQGIFPWYSEGEPIWWHSPDPRFVLEPGAIVVPRSLRKVMKKAPFEIRFDTAFAEVMRKRPFEIRFDTAFREIIVRCGQKRRPGQRGTWITPEMKRAYVALHELGFAHSAEAWQDGRLVGGLYGVSLGDVYFGESMFADVDDASKVAFVTLVRWLLRQGIQLIDSQVYTEHVKRFGGVEWSRDAYLARLAELVHLPTRSGRWVLAADDPAIGEGAGP